MRAKTRAGGFYGWWLLVFLWVAYTLPIGFAAYSAAVLYPSMIREMGWSRGEIMLGYTAMLLLLGLAAPIAIWMIRRFGARVTMFFGGLLVAVAASLIGLFGTSYPLYILLSLVIGLGLALATQLTIQTVIISWFSIRRAMALGLVLGGGGIGGFLAPQLTVMIVRNAGGDWRIGWFIVAIAAAVTAVVSLVTVRNHPSDLGQQPDGLLHAEAKKRDDARQQSSRIYRTTTNWTVRGAARTPALWFLMVAAVGGLFLWQVVLTQTPLHLQDRGFDPAVAAFFYSLAIGLSIVGRFAIAGLGDIIEPRILVACASVCILLGGVLFWFVSPDAVWTAYLYALLAGVGLGAMVVCLPTIVGNYWGVEAFAGIYGLLMMVYITSSGLAAPIAGFIYDRQGSYFLIMVISWIAAVFGFVAILLCRPPKPREESPA